METVLHFLWHLSLFVLQIPHSAFKRRSGLLKKGRKRRTRKRRKVARTTDSTNNTDEEGEESLSMSIRGIGGIRGSSMYQLKVS